MGLVRLQMHSCTNLASGERCGLRSTSYLQVWPYNTASTFPWCRSCSVRSRHCIKQPRTVLDKQLLRLATQKDGTASLTAASASVLSPSTKLEVGVSSERASSMLQVICRRQPR